jgi:acyl transferase domain-containing protein/NADP-dependent 3-hydroxy acid dehydrogenase YdfG/uncharacterized ubiquitin-like protein YukD
MAEHDFTTRPIAVVGLGANLPDAPDVASFWKNLLASRCSITDVTPDRWRADFYFDSDPSAPDKTYSKIGGWVRGFNFEPLKWGIPIPPRIVASMDESQQWAIAVSRQALMDFDYQKKTYDPSRVAVIFGNALAGESHYKTALRIRLPEFSHALSNSAAFQQLPADVQRALVQGMQDNIRASVPEITEDTMPGELANIIAGRVANVFNFGGPNFVTDAACASSLAALEAAVEGLNNYQFDLVLTGGVDRNMGPDGFVKFCKIGALSPDGSRPYSDGANGFVMGEGAAIFVLKRLVDAERDGDRIYAVVRGVGSSSDGKGKGITAPNPIGQTRAIERAWKNAGISPATVSLIEGHGTSTRVGDVVEVNSLNSVFGQLGLPVGSVALGSVKSNIGHLKSAAGAAGMLKAVLALYEKVLPPSANFIRPNPNIDFAHLPFSVVTQARPWERPAGEPRRVGVSSFGFGGTNFHLVMEEYIPGLATGERKAYPSVELTAVSPAVNVPVPVMSVMPASTGIVPAQREPVGTSLADYGSLLFLSAATPAELQKQLADVLTDARQGKLPVTVMPSTQALSRPERLAIEFSNAEELIKRGDKALKAFEEPGTNWQALTTQSVYHGSGRPGKLAFLFPGQGSQYANMLRDLYDFEPIIKETFREADEVMTPILGKPLTSYIFVDSDEESLKKAEAELRNTTITQPAVLTANVAMLRLMMKFGYHPDVVVGHSLGEYAALVASGMLTFPEALRVVSARGREMTKVAMADNGCLAAVPAPLEEVKRTLKTIDGYVVIANINSPLQSVIGGTTAAVDAALATFQAAGYQATKIPVSHAFHTQIVAPASAPLRAVVAGMNIRMPRLPVVANVTGEEYPADREKILDILAAQVASPVQMVKSMQRLYNMGVRVYVEIGPKRVLSAIATDNLKGKTDVSILGTNHPRKGGKVSFKEAMCGLFAAGISWTPDQSPAPVPQALQVLSQPSAPSPSAPAVILDGRLPLTGSVVISGAGLGLPGRNGHVFQDDNIQRILRGDNFIDSMPEDARQDMLQKRVTRLNKNESGATLEMIEDIERTVKLAGQHGAFDLGDEFGVPAERSDTYDISTQLAIGAGIEALRDAGIPLVMNYRQTSRGTYLPNRWMLPAALMDETGVIFASAFPGLQRMTDEADAYYHYQGLSNQLQEIRNIQALVPTGQVDLQALLAARISELEAQLIGSDYHLDRRFIFRILAMGHAQFAEYIGARGPNTHVNAACASTTHAVSVAEDWIRAGRCRRVVIVAGDDVSSGRMAAWIGSGLWASGAATTEGDPRLAILPFDRRRNGMIMGMGAAALVVEAEDAARERGVRAIAEVLSAQIANSAFHGTRLDVAHVSSIMERLVSQAEQRFGINRAEIAAQTVFVSHETYTPARGGSAAAEIHALRRVFGDRASQVVIANTKGFTGHSMGVGIEDVVAVKALEYGVVPPIANIQNGFEPDSELGDLNLSHGGNYAVHYALRLGAGFGSQIALTLLRRVPGEGERIQRPIHQAWLTEVSGYKDPHMEVVQRTLRVHNVGQPARTPRPSRWQFGQAPTLWAATESTFTQALTTQATMLQAPALQQPAVTSPVLRPSIAAPGYEEIKSYVQSVVSEKTGYPPDMLDLELDLEADLGVDTVKQAELFVTIRTHYNIPRREDLRLSDYNTLAKVIGFIQDALKAGLGKTAPAAAQLQSVAPQPVTPQVAAPRTIVPQVPASQVSAPVEEIKAYVLSVVSEKTGYPPDMLDLDLDLEADLGVDTVKQAELFATVRTHYNIPRREDLRLAEYNTLAKVIGFIQNALAQQAGVIQPVPVAAQDQQTTPSPTPLAAHEATDGEIKAYVLSVVSEKTGYPPEMLDLDLDLEADLGVDTVKQAELFATVRTHYGIPRREDLRLADYNTLAKVIGFIQDALAQQTQAAAPALPVVQPVDEVSQAVSEAQVLPEVQPEPAPAATEVIPPQASLQEAQRMDLPSYDEVKTYILLLVSERTGYAPDMLDLHLDVEVYFGIDKTQQAELFATLCAHFGIQRCTDLRQDGRVTLAKVIEFFRQALGVSLASAVPQPAPEQPAQVEVEEDASLTTEEEKKGGIVRRIPMPVLRARLEITLPTGVTLDSGSRVVVVADHGKVADSLTRRLRNRKVQVLAVNGNSSAAALKKVSAWVQEGSVQGMYFLPALDAEPSLDEMTQLTWGVELERRAGLLFALVRALPGQPFLVCATRMGGLHGYTVEGASAPLGGLVSGFTKALAQERPEALIKVVDFAADVPAASLAGHLIEETLNDPGLVEVGYEEERRFSIELIEQPLDETQPGFTWDASSVFLVSGGAGGITVPVVLDLARARGGVFYLLGRTPLPQRDSPDLAKLAADRNAFRQELTRRMAEGGKKPTPTQVESKLQTLERAAAALHLLDALAETDCRAQYVVCDVSDAQAAQQVVEGVLQAEGRVDVFLHAAGMERSRKLENKPAEEFNQTIAIKADGFFNIYHALQQSNKLPQAVVFFTSVAGRFGNSGQTDYSAANDLLCKLSTALPRLHPEIRTLALDWGAWAEVGMAARGNIPRLMEYAGIEMLKPEEAAPLVRQELQYNPGGEVLLAGALGLLMTPRHPSGGVDLERANLALIQGSPQHVMLARLTGYNPHEGILLEAELDPQAEPFLKDHALNGTSLLPGVIGIEGFTVAAQHVASALGSGKGSFYVDRLEDIQFRMPFKFFRNEPRRITWKAQVVRESSGMVAYASMESDLTRRSGRVEHFVHFTGKVHLQPQPIHQGIKVEPPYWNGSNTVKSEEIYRLYFHGPSFQVLEAVQRSGGCLLGKLNAQRPPLTRHGGEQSGVPILVELCLQTAGVWEIGATGKLALPSSIGKLVVYDVQAEGAVLYAEVRPSEVGDGTLRFDARVVDDQGRLYLEISDYRTARMADNMEEILLEPMKTLVREDEA